MQSNAGVPGQRGFASQTRQAAWTMLLTPSGAIGAGHPAIAVRTFQRLYAHGRSAQQQRWRRQVQRWGAPSAAEGRAGQCDHAAVLWAAAGARHRWQPWSPLTQPAPRAPAPSNRRGHVRGSGTGRTAAMIATGRAATTASGGGAAAPVLAAATGASAAGWGLYDAGGSHAGGAGS